MKGTHYLIEYRFQGSSKYEIRKMINHLEKKFRLPGGKKVPHITLAGGFTTDNERKLVKDFVLVCSKTPLCKFTVDGFGYFDNKTGGVVFININPNENLKTFRWDLAQTLSNYCILKEYDYKQDFEFHATLAMKLETRDFSKIKKYIDEYPEPQYKQVLIRATLLKNGRIMYEYDFLQKRLLTRSEALSKRELTKTFQLLKDYFKGSYNPNAVLSPVEIIEEMSWLSKIPIIGKLFFGGK